MRSVQVLARLHLDQATDGTVERKAEPCAGVQLVRVAGGRQYEFDAAVVKFVHERDESPRAAAVRETREETGLDIEL